VVGSPRSNREFVVNPSSIFATPFRFGSRVKMIDYDYVWIS
jgi:hypothetical protein